MEAFLWMFKEKDFKKYYFKLLFSTLGLNFLAIVLTVLLYTFALDKFIMEIFFYIIIFFLLLTPILLPTGYFWELTEKIIDRETDVQANSVYNGKIKKTWKFELPEFSITRFIWRGFASIVANIIMIVPYLLLLFIGIKNNSFCTFPQILIISLILFALLVPALLWNYAKQNSVFAVLNIPKAVNIMGNYPFRYLKTIILLFIIYLINVFLDEVIIKMILPYITGIFDFKDILIILGIIIYSIFIIIKSFYLIFINAYLLGTLTPENEF